MVTPYICFGDEKDLLSGIISSVYFLWTYFQVDLLATEGYLYFVTFTNRPLFVFSGFCCILLETELLSRSFVVIAFTSVFFYLFLFGAFLCWQFSCACLIGSLPRKNSYFFFAVVDFPLSSFSFAFPTFCIWRAFEWKALYACLIGIPAEWNCKTLWGCNRGLFVDMYLHALLNVFFFL